MLRRILGKKKDKAGGKNNTNDDFADNSNRSVGSSRSQKSGKKKKTAAPPEVAVATLPPRPEGKNSKIEATKTVDAALKKQSHQQQHHEDDEAEHMMGQSWASSLSGGFSTPGSTDDEGDHGSKGSSNSGGHHRATSMSAMPDKGSFATIKPSASSGSLKKASLRRTSSAANPKVLQHSASAIGLDEMMEDRREFGTLGQNVVHLEVPFGKPIEEVYDGVHNGPVLGSGISGMVRLATHKATGIKYAVKVLDLGLVESPDGLEQLREEIYIMCQLDHPNIVRLEEVYESHSEIYLVQELCLGGELFDRLDEQPDYHYTEGECARLVKQMLSAVRYLHSRGVIHRGKSYNRSLFAIGFF